MTNGLRACIAFAIMVAPACRSPGPCEPVREDVVSFVKGPVYSACQVDQRATPPVSLRQGGQGWRYNACGRLTLEVVIDSTGSAIMPTVRVLKTSDTAFTTEVLRAVAESRFSPARLNGRRVAQQLTLEQSVRGALPAKVPFAVARAGGGAPSEPIPRVPPQPTGC